MTKAKPDEKKIMTGRMTFKDYRRIRSIAYWLRNVLAELKDLSPEARAEFGKVIGDSDLSQFKDLEALEKALRKISFS